ncbi:collagen-binding protein [Deltaproteobacteria bacterium]|nr:collagen-binding protein [Deltaproteobacteria bacterium]
MILALIQLAFAEETAESEAEGDDPHEVVVEARRDPPVVSSHTLDRERVLLTPGTFEDAVRLVQALPGVALTPEYSPSAGDLAVRGSDPSETRYLLDGIELPYLYHFNGYSSVLPARLLDELQLYPSTFGAEFGDATGAIVDTRSTWSRPERPRASANVNFVMAGAEVAAPSGEDWTVRASARRSYLDLVTKDDPQYSAFPAFSDWYGRLEYAPSSDARWAITGFGAGDAYTRAAGEPTLLDPYEQSVNPSFVYDKHYNVGQIAHRHLVGANKVEGALAVTGYSVTGDLPAAHDHEGLLRMQLREDATLSLAPWCTLATGATGKFESLALDVETDRAWHEVVRESPLLDRGVSTEQVVERAIVGAYAEGRFSAGKLRFVPGVRVDGDTLSGAAIVDPRFNARWRIGADEQLRVALGQYSQFAQTAWLAPGVGDPTLPPSVSRQAAIGFDYAIAHRLEVALSGWGKVSENLVEAEPGEPPVGGVSGTAYGLEVESRYRIRNLFFASLALTLAHSEHDDHVSDYDQPWAFNLIGSWSFLPTWNAGLRYRASEGLPYTAVIDGAYQADDDTYTPVYGETNGARLPAFQKIDVHIQKDLRFRTWSLALYSELWFVPPGSNVMYEAWSYDYDAVGEVRGPVFIPLLGARGEWGLDPVATATPNRKPDRRSR